MEIVVLHQDDPVADALAVANGVSTVEYRGDVYVIYGNRLKVIYQLGDPDNVAVGLVWNGALNGLIVARGRLFATSREGPTRVYEIKP